MKIPVFLAHANYTKEGFDHQYVEIVMTDMLKDGNKGNEKFIEYLLYDDYTKKLYEHVNMKQDIELIKDIVVKFPSGDNEYVFNNIAQLGLSIELFAFMNDMEENAFNPLPGDNLADVYN